MISLRSSCLWTIFIYLFIHLFIQYLKRCTLLAEIAIPITKLYTLKHNLQITHVLKGCMDAFNSSITSLKLEIAHSLKIIWFIIITSQSQQSPNSCDKYRINTVRSAETLSCLSLRTEQQRPRWSLKSANSIRQGPDQITSPSSSFSVA